MPGRSCGEHRFIAGVLPGFVCQDSIFDKRDRQLAPQSWLGFGSSQQLLDLGTSQLAVDQPLDLQFLFGVLGHFSLSKKSNSKILHDQSPQALPGLEQSVFNSLDFGTGMPSQLFIGPVLGVLQQQDFPIPRLQSSQGLLDVGPFLAGHHPVERCGLAIGGGFLLGDKRLPLPALGSAVKVNRLTYG
jgi:hypothetical protein